MGVPLTALSFPLRSLEDTGRFGRVLAGLVAPGDALYLSGPLGAGKTALARAIIQTWVPGEEVASPTFTLVQTYSGPGFEVQHFDLYRVESGDEVWELGWGEPTGSVLLVEWPERLAI